MRILNLAGRRLAASIPTLILILIGVFLLLQFPYVLFFVLWLGTRLNHLLCDFARWVLLLRVHILKSSLVQPLEFRESLLLQGIIPHSFLST